MKTSKNTVLISGGSAGIGFQLAKLFSENGNHVIITGRDKGRLQNSASRLKNVTPVVSDVSNENDVNQLVKRLADEFPNLNVVINNAASAFVYDVTADEQAFENAREEMLTNYLSVIRLNEKLLSILRKQPESAIVNVSSVVAFVPGSLATYSASKAALHSYTQSLRIALESTSNVKVFELMPPLVDTEFSKPIGGHNGVSPLFVAEQFLEAFKNDEYEVRVGKTEDIYRLYLASPDEALRAMNSLRKELQVENN